LMWWGGIEKKTFTVPRSGIFPVGCVEAKTVAGQVGYSASYVRQPRFVAKKRNSQRKKIIVPHGCKSQRRPTGHGNSWWLLPKVLRISVHWCHVVETACFCPEDQASRRILPVTNHVSKLEEGLQREDMLQNI